MKSFTVLKTFINMPGLSPVLQNPQGLQMMELPRTGLLLAARCDCLRRQTFQGWAGQGALLFLECPLYSTVAEQSLEYQC